MYVVKKLPTKNKQFSVQLNFSVILSQKNKYNFLIV